MPWIQNPDSAGVSDGAVPSAMAPTTVATSVVRRGRVAVVVASGVVGVGWWCRLDLGAGCRRWRRLACCIASAPGRCTGACRCRRRGRGRAAGCWATSACGSGGMATRGPGPGAGRRGGAGVTSRSLWPWWMPSVVPLPAQPPGQSTDGAQDADAPTAHALAAAGWALLQAAAVHVLLAVEAGAVPAWLGPGVGDDPLGPVPDGRHLPVRIVARATIA